MSSEGDSDLRVYKTWKSENKFYCRGKCVTGPDRIYFHLSWFFVCLPVIFYFSIVNVNLLKYYDLVWIAAFIEAFLFLLNISSFLMASFMDPGILPRKPPLPVNVYNSFEHALIPMTKSINICGVDYQIKFCDTCNIYRPARVIHCGVCNNCVDRFDHHCPWLGNCVGKRNYKYFIMFVFSVVINAAYLIGLCILEMIVRYHNLEGTKNFANVLKNPASFIIAIYSAGAFVFVGQLALYHCKLINRGVTTNEYIKRIFQDSNPYSKGCIGNWFYMCCPPFYPTFAKFSQKVSVIQNDRDIEIGRV